MSLRDDLDPPKKSGGYCSVRAFVETKPCDEQHVFEGKPLNGCKDGPADWTVYVNDRSIQHSRIHQLMRKHGFDGSANPVQRHRSGVCACGRSSG